MIIDWLFSAGQAVSAIGLGFGLYWSVMGARLANKAGDCDHSAALSHDLRTA